MLRKSNIDKDPNSIFNASSKLATISVRNIKNPSDDPNMQLGLNKLPPSIIGNNPSLINRSSLLTPNVNISRTFTNTDVDEFLNLIKESNVSLESLHLLLNVYKDKVKVKGSGLHKKFKGGADEPVDFGLEEKKEPEEENIGKKLDVINAEIDDCKNEQKYYQKKGYIQIRLRIFKTK